MTDPLTKQMFSKEPELYIFLRMFMYPLFFLICVIVIAGIASHTVVKWKELDNALVLEMVACQKALKSLRTVPVPVPSNSQVDKQGYRPKQLIKEVTREL